MGDPFGVGSEAERPVRRVYVSPFLLDRYPVTLAQWTTVREWALDHGYDLVEGAGRGPDHPVTNVNWYNALKWANARSEIEGREPAYTTDATGQTVYRSEDIDLTVECVRWGGEGYRLPTDADWEKAARGGLEGQQFPWPSADKDFLKCIDPSRANFGEDEGGTTPVTKYASNGLGLHDMAGNVWQWVWDGYEPWAYAAREASRSDPRGPKRGLRRTLRGGSWGFSAVHLRCAYRHDEYLAYCNSYTGFRLALDHSKGLRSP